MKSITNLIAQKKLPSLLLLIAFLTSGMSCAKSEEPLNENTNETTNQTSSTDITDPIKHGEKAHKNHCVKCHGDGVYTREDRFVKSIDALSKQVVRCKDNTNTPWFDEDTEAVVQFLNEKYYRF